MTISRYPVLPSSTAGSPAGQSANVDAKRVMDSRPARSRKGRVATVGNSLKRKLVIMFPKRSTRMTAPVQMRLPERTGLKKSSRA